MSEPLPEEYPMPVITLTQPWATLIALGKKRIETRTWRMHRRGRIGIHAAKAMTPEAMACLERPEFRAALGDLACAEKLPRGAVVATVELVEILPTKAYACRKLLQAEYADDLPFGDFRSGRYAWFLRDVRPFATPVPVRGAQGIWLWGGEPQL